MPRRRKRRIRKPDAHAKARWYVGRGYPLSFIAEKLKVSRNTVRSWSLNYADTRVLRSLQHRITSLPEYARRQLFARLADMMVTS